MKLTKILIGVAAAAFLSGCASQHVSDEGTEGKEGSCCASGQKDGKSCCSESAGQCTEKKEAPAQKN
jgi:uncharacterized protein YceK